MKLESYCPNLEYLNIEYTRELDNVGYHLKNLKKLTHLILPHCTMNGSLSDLINLKISVLDLQGDSWINFTLLNEIS